MYTKISPLNTLTPASVAATTAPGVALSSNASRRYAMFVNDSDTVIYLGPSTAATLTVRLNASGGSWEMSEGLGNLYRGAIYQSSTTAGKVLLVTEGI